MPTIKRNALVTYTPEQMFSLVDNIASYPDFLPWCRSSREHDRNDNEVRATIEIAKGHVNKSFTTHNRLQHYKTIEMRLIDGPFKQLHGFWRFDELNGSACKVSLDLDFEFSNKLVGLAIGPIFNQVANTLVDAFVQRAKVVYD